MFQTLIALASIWITLILLTPAMSQAAEPIASAEIQKQLVGKWFEDLYSHGFHIKATANYSADGTVEIEGVMTRGKRKLKLAITGSWKVEDGKLVETVATCQPPVLRSGREIARDVVEISEGVFRYLNEDGDEGVRTRVME